MVVREESHEADGPWAVATAAVSTLAFRPQLPA